MHSHLAPSAAQAFQAAILAAAAVADGGGALTKVLKSVLQLVAECGDVSTGEGGAWGHAWLVPAVER